VASSNRLYETPAQTVAAAPAPQLLLLRAPESAMRNPVPFGLDTVDPRWPAPVRFAVIFGAATACWAMIGVPLLLIWG
jgi:hypothetical protein